MNRSELTVCLLVLVIVGLASGHRRYHDRGSADSNLLQTVQTTDGRRIRRVIRDGVLAMETTVPRHPEGLFSWEVSDGKKIVRTIVSDRAGIMDCDIRTSNDALSSFSDRFFPNSRGSSSERTKKENLTGFQHGETMPPELLKLTNMQENLANCRKYRRQVKIMTKRAKHAKGEFRLRAKRETTAVTEEEESEYGIFPGTNWCGKGNATTDNHVLGIHSETDRCCRTHDHCPYFISALTTKYGLFNFRLHTLSHCDCDYQFRECLKETSNAVSDMVGSLYFNLAGLKCFMFEERSVCTKRNWLYICEEYSTVYEATVHDALPY